MESPGDLVCETRYCPECGTQLFCSVVPGGELLLYLSEQMDQPVEECPQCRFGFAALSFEDFAEAPVRGNKKQRPRRKTAGKKDVLDALMEVGPEEFSSKAAAERAFDAVGNAFSELIGAGMNIRWPGVGTFKIRERKARRGRNPQTGEAMEIPATTGLGFTPAKHVKKKLQAL